MQTPFLIQTKISLLWNSGVFEFFLWFPNWFWQKLWKMSSANWIFNYVLTPTNIFSRAIHFLQTLLYKGIRGRFSEKSLEFPKTWPQRFRNLFSGKVSLILLLFFCCMLFGSPTNLVIFFSQSCSCGRFLAVFCVFMLHTKQFFGNFFFVVSQLFLTKTVEDSICELFFWRWFSCSFWKMVTSWISKNAEHCGKFLAVFSVFMLHTKQFFW